MFVKVTWNENNACRESIFISNCYKLLCPTCLSSVSIEIFTDRENFRLVENLRFFKYLIYIAAKISNSKNIESYNSYYKRAN